MLGQEFIWLLSFYKFNITIFYKKVIVEGFLIALLYLKETDIETITTIVKRYYDQDTWKENLIFEKHSFELLQDILEDAGELKERTPYTELVNTEFAQNAS